MRTRGLVLLAVLALFAGPALAATPPSPDGAQDAFAGRMLAAAPGGENLALSPFSISQALAMIDMGAQGTTARQLAATLDVGLDPAALARAFSTLDGELAAANRSGVTLSTANALYGQSGYPFRASFLGLLSGPFGAPLQAADFAADPGWALATINGWVARRTRGKITDLLSPADVDSSTLIVLVNALYLDAKWQTPFEHLMTAAGTFHAAGGAERVAMMNQTNRFAYRRAAGYAVAELPYVGGRLAFDVLLPDPGHLDAVIRTLARRGAATTVGRLHVTEIALTLPKLLLRTRLELARPLQSLGLKLVFEPGRADLSGMGGAPGDLYLAHVVHEAYLRVDEAGTQAAAATGGTVQQSLELAPPFDVDRPFVYLLRDRLTGAVLFAGIVRRP